MTTTSMRIPSGTWRCGPSSEMVHELARRVVTAPERWGWEYEPEPDPRPYPVPEPRWVETVPPDLREVYARAAADKAGKQKLAGVGGAVAILGLMVVGGSAGAGAVILIVGIAVAVLALVAANATSSRLAEIQNRTEDHRRKAVAVFERAVREWRSAASAHDTSERARVAALPLLHPIAPNDGAGRIDCFGGTVPGWARC